MCSGYCDGFQPKRKLTSGNRNKNIMGALFLSIVIAGYIAMIVFCFIYTYIHG